VAGAAAAAKRGRPRRAKEQNRQQAKPPIKRRNAVATRARILQAAMQEFAAKGLDAARIEDIADQAGANRRMTYYYFGSKEGLYLAALEAAYFELVEVEKRIDVDRLGPIEAIDAMVQAKFEHYVKYPHYVEFVKMENLYRARHLKTSRRIAEMRAPLISIIKRVLDRGEAAGLLRRGVDPLDLYLSICALGFFVFSNRHTLGVIFNTDVTSTAALRKRRSLVVDMIKAYLTP
jgi:TetR/AcrR family transcriptional regulator